MKNLWIVYFQFLVTVFVVALIVGIFNKDLAILIAKFLGTILWMILIGSVIPLIYIGIKKSFNSDWKINPNNLFLASLIIGIIVFIIMPT